VTNSQYPHMSNSKFSEKERKTLRTWIEIDTKKAKKNFQFLKKLLGKKTKFTAVTKSNAYGHGLVDYSKLMEKFGADWICVDSIVEAKTLRDEGLEIPILVMGYTLPDNFFVARKNNISVTISTFEGLESALKYRDLRIHLKFDTGMGRQGFLVKDLPEIFKFIKKSPITIEGISTHFAKAKTPKKNNETNKQIKIFKEIVSSFKKEGYGPMAHAGATAGGVVFREAHFDMVRFGIGIYGLWPNKSVEKSFKREVKLEPVLSWKTVISEIKTLPKGHGVGYDLTHKLKKSSKIAICPVGYWHGYSRALSNKGYVLVNGKKVDLLGRVSMDMIIIDISNVGKISVGDEVVLIGYQKGKKVTAEDIADLTGTINYEIITRINPLIKKFYI
jgi:alanine racemase